MLLTSKPILTPNPIIKITKLQRDRHSITPCVQIIKQNNQMFNINNIKNKLKNKQNQFTAPSIANLYAIQINKFQPKNQNQNHRNLIINNNFKIKTQSCQIEQPQGDGSNLLFNGGQQQRRALTNRKYSSPMTNMSDRRSNKSTSRLQTKNKPFYSYSNTNSSRQIQAENEILKIENQKLKEISQNRKYQISNLIQQVQQLKSQMQNQINPKLVHFNQIQKDCPNQNRKSNKVYLEQRSSPFEIK